MYGRFPLSPRSRPTPLQRPLKACCLVEDGSLQVRPFLVAGENFGDPGSDHILLCR